MLLASRHYAQQPPVYTPPAANYYQAPPPAYAAPSGPTYAFVPHETFPTAPPRKSCHFSGLIMVSLVSSRIFLSCIYFFHEAMVLGTGSRCFLVVISMIVVFWQLNGLPKHWRSQQIDRRSQTLLMFSDCRSACGTADHHRSMYDRRSHQMNRRSRNCSC